MNTSEKKPASGLLIRVVSGLILAPVTVALIVAGGWYFTTLVALGALIAVSECTHLAKKLPNSYLFMVAGVGYTILAAVSYVFLRFGFEQGAWLALVVMLCVWSSDIGAYFIGKAIGGPKLAPVISPNKTWAGFAGAMFSSGLAIIILAGISPYLDRWIFTDLNLKSSHVAGLFVIGAVLGAVGQAGDLMISFFKRKAGVKDTGVLIPGHGGLLDRIDSLMLVCPVFVVIVLLWLS